MHMNWQHHILFVLTLTFIAGIHSAYLFHPPLWMIYTALGTSGLILGVCFKNKPHWAIFCLVGLFFFAGMFRLAQVQVVFERSDWSSLQGRQVIVTGTVTEMEQEPDVAGGQVRVMWLLKATQLQESAKIRPVAGKVRVYVTYPLTQSLPSYGDQLRVRGRLQPVFSYRNPGAFEQNTRILRDGLYGRISAKPAEVLLEKQEDKSIIRRVLSWRDGLYSLFAATMPHQEAALLNSLLFGGGYQRLEPRLVQEFAATGIIHILSVSGSHMSLVAAGILWLAVLLRINHKVRVIVACTGMLVYAFLAGFSPPVLRSVLMGILALAALLVERERSGVAALAAAALVMLMWNPALLYDISFQLSFAGTSGLVFCYRPLQARLLFLPAPLASGLALTLSAQLLMVPLLGWYFQTLPLGSLLSNLLVVPFLDATLLLGLCAALISLLNVTLAKLVLLFASGALSAGVEINHWIAMMKFLRLNLPVFSWSAICLYYAGVASISYVWQNCKRQLPIWLPGTVCLCLCFLLLVIRMPQPVQVHFIDVGQGDATLIITPHGRSIMIDTGGVSKGDNSFDVGEKIVVPYLSYQGIRRLDYLFLTHGHADHAGGAAGIARNVPIGIIYYAPEPLSESELALQKQKDPNTPMLPAVLGLRIRMDGILIQVEFIPETEMIAEHGSSNEHSMVVRISYGNQSVLVTGDLTGKQEESMVNRGFAPCSILKVAHHGAKTSSMESFLDKAAPQYAVISVGRNNAFGHPHPEVLERLQARGISVRRTDQTGAVIFTTDGVSWKYKQNY